MRRHLERLDKALMLALWTLVVGGSLLTTAHANDVRFDVEFSHLGGDLTPEQRDAMVRSAEIEAQFAPLAKVPGVTARWESCGLLSFPCLRTELRYLRVAADAVGSSGGALTFSVPLRHGGGLHRLSTVTIEMSGPRASSGLPRQRLTLRIPVNCESCRQEEIPFVARDDYDVLRMGGSIRAKGVLLGAAPGCGAGHCVFPKTGRFDGYSRLLRQGASHWAASRQEIKLPEPYPPEFIGLEVVEAALVAARLDGHLLERIDLRTRKENSCSQEQRVFLVDGKVTSYWRKRQEQNCSSHSASARIVSAKWSEDGRALMLEDRMTNPNLPEPLDWMAQGEAPSAGTPQAQVASELQQDGMRLRQYFGSSQ